MPDDGRDIFSHLVSKEDKALPLDPVSQTHMQPSSTPEISASDSLVLLWVVRMLHIGWLINNRDLFLWFWRLGSPRSRCQQVQCLGRTLPGSEWPFFAVSSYDGNPNKLVGFPCIINPFNPQDRGTSGRLQIPSQWRVGSNTGIWRTWLSRLRHRVCLLLH